MGWSIGVINGRDVGYGVPATCDHPGCAENIDRGISFVCGEAPAGGEYGCGLFFCATHRTPVYFGEGEEDSPDADDDAFAGVCTRCAAREAPFDPTPDVAEWVEWKLTDSSWERWRQENPAGVNRLRAQLEAAV